MPSTGFQSAAHKAEVEETESTMNKSNFMGFSIGPMLSDTPQQIYPFTHQIVIPAEHRECYSKKCVFDSFLCAEHPSNENKRELEH